LGGGGEIYKKINPPPSTVSEPLKKIELPKSRPSLSLKPLGVAAQFPRKMENPRLKPLYPTEISLRKRRIRKQRET
jgi:hypothetical protein